MTRDEAASFSAWRRSGRRQWLGYRLLPSCPMRKSIGLIRHVMDWIGMKDFVTRMRVSFHWVTGLPTAHAASRALHYRS
ncbi:MAG: hypothetical protein ACJ8G3_06780, partial [Burkholderiaceae bacterium]